MTKETGDSEKRLLAATVFQLRVLLAGHLDDKGPAGDASQLVYALHNQALAALEGRAFDVTQALASLQRLESRLGSDWLEHFRRVIRNEA